MKQTNKEHLIKYYDKYSQSIFRYILKMTRNAHTSEDLTQETFIKAFEFLSSDKELTHPKTFLYRIAHNLTIDYFRKAKPIYMTKDFFMKQQSNELPVESIAIINEESKEVYLALQQLKESYRQVIVLRRIEGFSTQETAIILK